MIRAILAVAAFVIAAPFSLAQDVSVIETDAEFAVIMDHDTEEVLFSKRGDEPMVPASMTKIMIAQVVFDDWLRRIRLGRQIYGERKCLAQRQCSLRWLNNVPRTWRHTNDR